jgi:hypothetical protein
MSLPSIFDTTLVAALIVLVGMTSTIALGVLSLLFRCRWSAPHEASAAQLPSRA